MHIQAESLMAEIWQRQEVLSDKMEGGPKGPFFIIQIYTKITFKFVHIFIQLKVYISAVT